MAKIDTSDRECISARALAMKNLCGYGWRNIIVNLSGGGYWYRLRSRNSYIVVEEDMGNPGEFRADLTNPDTGDVRLSAKGKTPAGAVQTALTTLRAQSAELSDYIAAVASDR